MFQPDPNEAQEVDRRLIALLEARVDAQARLFSCGSGGAPSFIEALNHAHASLEGISCPPSLGTALRVIYREIVSTAYARVQPLRIAYLGPEATFTHAACLQQFGHQAGCVAVESIGAVFESVARGRTEYGVVPVENSTEGAVNPTLDMFVEFDLKICGEILLGIEHHLLSISRDFERIRRVYSHPQALAQCRPWLERHLPHVELVEEASTARAAHRAAQEEGAAAVAGTVAAAHYGLEVVAPSIQNSGQNFTRFFVLGYEVPGPTGRDKTSILFSVKHESGALFRALQSFAQEQLNLTQIESRPSKKTPWEYVFFVDVEGHITGDGLARALTRLEEACQFVKVLGSYPRSDRP